MSRSVRYTAMAVVAGGMLVTAAAAPAAASAAEPDRVAVYVRVEAPAETLFNGVVRSRPRLTAPTPRPDLTCAPRDGVVMLAPAVTAVTALADASARRGLVYAASDNTQIGNVCAIGAYANNATTGEQWRLKINNRPADPARPLKAGDKILWYFGGPGLVGTLDLDLPARARLDRFFDARVSASDNISGRRLAPGTLGISIEGSPLGSSTDGRFQLKISTPGKFTIAATSASTARGSDVICVYRPGSGDCGTKKRKKR